MKIKNLSIARFIGRHFVFSSLDPHKLKTLNAIGSLKSLRGASESKIDYNERPTRLKISLVGLKEREKVH